MTERFCRRRRHNRAHGHVKQHPSEFNTSGNARKVGRRICPLLGTIDIRCVRVMRAHEINKFVACAYKLAKGDAASRAFEDGTLKT